MNVKIKIAEAAAERFVQNDRFTYESVAQKLSTETAVIHQHFATRGSMLSFFYESRIHLYRNQVELLDDYKDFNLGEKLSDFFLFLFDQFAEYNEFVLKTYNKLIINNSDATSFEVLFKKQIQSIFESDKQLSASSLLLLRPVFYNSVYLKFQAFYHFWIQDDSEHQQQTMALIDKWSTFVEELFYTKLIDKGADLAKFLFYNSPLNQFLHK